MLRIYVRVLAAAFCVTAIVAALPISSSAGLGVSVLLSVFYLGSGAIFAYAGFSRRSSTIIRSVVAVMGILLLLTGVLVALLMGILGFPFAGRFWEVGLAQAAVGGLTMACAVLMPCSDE